ncbi:MAG: glycosyl transferase family 1, partial [Chloroflexi bacterium]|nr:glycosyl transferase family 1 [Chloroflexota bacterium]
MYPLDRGSWGPTVRIGHLRDELTQLVRLDVVAGTRGERRVALARYAVSGRLRGLDGIYVESSSFLP